MTNSDLTILKSNFPKITKVQEEQFKRLPELYGLWNAKINVISRKDIDKLFMRHILHSLAIAKLITFKDRSEVIDVGTGGGFPGIPLAIMFPEVRFRLIDSVAKKIKVVNEVCNELKLRNVNGLQVKSTIHKGKYDFVTGRAVTSFPTFFNSVKHLIKRSDKMAGILYLKGGDFEDELKEFSKIQVFKISDFFFDKFFETKKLIYLPY